MDGIGDVGPIDVFGIGLILVLPCDIICCRFYAIVIIIIVVVKAWGLTITLLLLLWKWLKLSHRHCL